MITNLFAGVAVADLAGTGAWYERLAGRPADLVPNDSELCWQLVAGGWIYLVVDPERARNAQLTFLVDDLDAQLEALVERGLEPGPVEEIPGKVRRARLTDPEGNTIAFGQPLG